MTTSVETGPSQELNRALRQWDHLVISARSGGQRAYRSRSGGLAAALRLFESARRGSVTGGLSSPSAGAQQPYEFYVLADEPEGPAAYLVDPARRSCHLLELGDTVRQALPADGPGAIPGHGALVLTAMRPWVSMRKYGDRGLLYTHLDAAHVAVHLQGLAAEANPPAELLLRAPDAALADLLRLEAHCRLPHSVLSLGPAPEGAGTELPGEWSVTDLRGAVASDSVLETSWLEQQCWRSLARRPESRPVAAGEPGEGPLGSWAHPLVGAVPFRSGRTRTELSAVRRSTKRFTPGAVPRDALSQALAALRTAVATDLEQRGRLETSLVALDVDGLAPGSLRLTATAAGTEAVNATGALSRDEVVAACMDQEHLRHAGAALLFHAHRSALTDTGEQVMWETVFRAGALAHLVYLGAADAGLAVTAIGGFDAARWRELAGLPADHEVVYVMFLGSGDENGTKLDRLQTAYAHNER